MGDLFQKGEVVSESTRAGLRMHVAMFLFFLYLAVPSFVSLGGGLGEKTFNFSVFLILLLPPYRYVWRKTVRWLRGEPSER